MYLTPNSSVMIQGSATSEALIHAALDMKAYGTNLVACVSPSHGGEQLHGIPVFDQVEQVQSQMGSIVTSVIWVPPYQVLDAALEAISANIQQLVILSEGMPPLDMIHLVRKAELTDTMVVGPNCAGIIIPNQLSLGVHPGEFYTPGSVGLISRGSTLTYEVALQLTQAQFGQSISVSIGRDLILGSSFIQWLQILDEDENTEVIVLMGEAAGSGEEEAASYIAETIDKPVVAYIAGLYAPSISPFGQGKTTATSKLIAQTPSFSTGDSKRAAFLKAKIPLADRPSQIPSLVKKVLKKK